MKFSVQEATAYRLNLLNTVLSSLIWGSFVFVSIFLLTSKTKSVLGWNREELFLLTANFSIMIGIFRIFILHNLDELARIIHTGKLDQYLLKPVDVQFWVSFRHANVGAVLRIPLSLMISIYILKLLETKTSFAEYLIFILLLLVGVIINYSIWFIAMTFIIWFTNLTNMKTLLTGIGGVTRYPKEIFDNTNLYLFLVFFPLTLVVSVPTKYLLGRASNSELYLLFSTALILFISARFFWKFALRYYSSASS